MISDKKKNLVPKVGFEPTRISAIDLKSTPLTTQASWLIETYQLREYKYNSAEIKKEIKHKKTYFYFFLKKNK